MKAMALVCAALTGLVLAFAAEGEKSRAPEVRVRKAAGAIRIDGRLDESSWKDASMVELRSADGKKEAAAPTRVKACHDGKLLYLGFICEDPDIWTAHRGRDSHMWTEDVVECFIDVNPGDPAYVELEVNPYGDLFDGIFFRHRGGVLMSWNPEIQAAVSVDGTVNRRDDKDRFWTVEMAIPAADLAPAESLGKPGAEMKPGAVWRINFNRVESSGGKSDLQSWAPVRGDFHEVGLFGLAAFE